MLVPIAMPITPISSTKPNNAEKNNLAAIVRVTDVIIVNLISPVARSPFPNGPANGYATPLNILLIRTSQIFKITLLNFVLFLL